MAKASKTANTNVAPGEEIGRLGRARRGVVNYGKRRLRAHDANWEHSRAGLKAGAAQIKETFAPKHVDRAEIRAGYEGRHADGGRAAFAEQMARFKIGDADLPGIAKSYARSTWLFGIFAVIFFAFGVFSIAAGGSTLSVLSGFAIIVTSLVIAALALRQSFSGWQVRNRRFGGVREYLRSKN